MFGNRFENIRRGMAGMSMYAAVLLLPAVSANAQTRFLGGDISLLPSYETVGTSYRTPDGMTCDALGLFTGYAGWNAARVRLFVNPSSAPQSNKDEGVCQDLEYVTALCRRVKAAGMSLMLDLHYSDTWADPGKQFTPMLWKDAGTETLCDSVYLYTVSVLSCLKANGVVPEQIQVGNEITFGMLWPTGRVDPVKDDNWNVLAALLKSGVKACRECCPGAKVIIHTEKAGEWNVTKSYYRKLDAFGVDYDIIGLSYYPMWHKSISNLDATLDSLAAAFPCKEVMIVETAFYYSHDNDVWITNPSLHSELYEISAAGQARFTRELVGMLGHHKNVTGLYWWFAEENESGRPVIKSWINRGLFDNHTGKALPAMTEFRKFLYPNGN